VCSRDVKKLPTHALTRSLEAIVICLFIVNNTARAEWSTAGKLARHDGLSVPIRPRQCLPPLRYSTAPPAAAAAAAAGSIHASLRSSAPWRIITSQQALSAPPAIDDRLTSPYRALSHLTHLPTNPLYVGLEIAHSSGKGRPHKDNSIVPEGPCSGECCDLRFTRQTAGWSVTLLINPTIDRHYFLPKENIHVFYNSTNYIWSNLFILSCGDIHLLR